MKRFLPIGALCAVAWMGTAVHAMPIGVRTLMWGQASARQAAVDPSPDVIVEQVTPYDGVYDGEGHGITVAVTKPDGAVVKFAYSAQGPYFAGAILFTNVTEETVTVWYTVEAANYASVTNSGTVKISPRSLTQGMVGAIGNHPYTGKAQTPKPMVTDVERGVTLREDVDYTLSYANNTALGNGIVTVTGKGNYTGSIARSFVIEPSTGSELEEILSGAGKAESDGEGGWVVTLTNDVDTADLPIEIPDNIGSVTIDLNGHDLIGGDGQPAIVIVPGSGDGEPTVLTVITTGGDATVQGGEGAPAIEVADDAQDGVLINIGAGVTVRGGGDDVIAIDGEIGENAGTVVKATYDMSGASWNYSAPFTYDGTEKTVEVTGLPTGVTVASYNCNTAIETGSYTAHVALVYDEANYNTPTMPDLVWRVVSAAVSAFDGVGISEETHDGWNITLTNDAEAIRIPDNLGNVTIDLNGFNIVGTNGCECANGGAAIEVYASGLDGLATHLKIVDSRPDEDADVVGGKGGKGLVGGSAVCVNTDASVDVRISITANVTVSGGDGFSDPNALFHGGHGGERGGNGAVGIKGCILLNEGVIRGGNGGSGCIVATRHGIGGAGVEGNVEHNIGTIRGGDGGNARGSDPGDDGGAGGAGVVGMVMCNDGTIIGGQGGYGYDYDSGNIRGGDGGDALVGNIVTNNGFVCGGDGGCAYGNYGPYRGGDGGCGVCGNVTVNCGSIVCGRGAQGAEDGNATSGDMWIDVGTVTGVVSGVVGNMCASIDAEMPDSELWEVALLNENATNFTYNGAVHGIAVPFYSQLKSSVVYSLDSTGPYAAQCPQFTSPTNVAIWYVHSSSVYSPAVTNVAMLSIGLNGISQDMVSPIPEQVYSGAAIEPHPMVRDSANSLDLVEGRDYTLSWSGNVDVGTACITVTGIGNFTGSTTKQFTVVPKQLTASMVGGVENVVYTGSALAPEPVVTDAARGVTLAKGTDYTLSYANNTAAGTATVTVAGKGNYAGSIPKNFTIAKQIVVPPTIASKVYTGGQQLATLASSSLYDIAQNAGGVDAGQYDVKLRLVDSANYAWPDVAGADTIVKFAITKASNEWLVAPSVADWIYGGTPSVPNMGSVKFGSATVMYDASGMMPPSDAGGHTATFAVAETANYAGLSTEVGFEIARKSIVGATVSLGPTLTYNGSEQTQSVLGVNIDGLNATFDTSGNKATDAGLYTLTVTGTGNFTGAVTAQWRIWPDGIVQQVTPYDGIYDGGGHGIAVTVTKPAGAEVKYAYAEQGPYAADAILFTNVTETAVTVWYMVEAENYTTITNCGTVKVSPKALVDAMVSLEDAEYIYDGTAKEPAVTVVDGDPSILAATDYEVAYSGNVDAGEATVTVTGKGNYTGTVMKHFKIAQAENEWLSEPSILGWVYGQQPNEPNMGEAKFGVATVTYGALGASRPTEVGSYVATFTVVETGNYTGLTKEVPFTISSVEETKLQEIFEGLPATVESDDEGGWIVTLTNDIDAANLPIEIPDDLGVVTIDLNGHDLVGGEGRPVVIIVPGDEEGEPTQLTIVTTGGDAIVQGGEGAPAIEVSDGVQEGVLINIGEGVTVKGGGDYAPAIIGEVGINEGTIIEPTRYHIPGEGTVTVPKSWKTDQKVTWKAVAAKGSVFAHWEGAFVDTRMLSKNERRNPSLAFAVPAGFDTNGIRAVFLAVDDDRLGKLALSQPGPLAPNVEVSGLMLVDDSESYVTASVSGLPTGLKFDAKTLAITGTPTKPGVYTVKITAKNASGYQWAENVELRVADIVDARIGFGGLPAEGTVGAAYAGQIAAGEFTKLSASGLPSGLKLDAKSGAVAGIPTKGGYYTVTVTANYPDKTKTTATWLMTISPVAAVPEPKRTAYHPLTVVCATDGGTATGTGVYAEGKKASIKATAAKKYVFAGWYRDAALKEPMAFASGDFRTASQSVIVPEARYLFARFEPESEDIKSLKVAVADAVTETDGTYALDLGACVESLSLPKLAVTGLPAGLKYDAKTLKVTGKATKPGVYAVTVKATNTSVKKATDGTTATFTITVPNFTCGAMPGLLSATDAYGAVSAGVALDPGHIDCTPADGWTVKAAGLPTGLKYDAKTGKIAGVPTAKPGPYTVTFTASKKGEANQVATITLNVEALPAWAVGTFDGAVFAGDSVEASGIVQAFTVAANGKISGKLLEGGKTWTLSAANFSRVERADRVEESDVFYATVIGKAGKEIVTNEVTVSVENGVGVATSQPFNLSTFQHFNFSWTAWQNLWKRADTKAAMPVIKKDIVVKDYPLVVEGDKNNTVKITFKKDGAVTFAGLVDGAKVSGSSQLVRLAGDGSPYQVTLYAPPKSTAKPPFEGWCETLAVTLTVDGQNSVTDVDVK